MNVIEYVVVYLAARTRFKLVTQAQIDALTAQVQALRKRVATTDATIKQFNQ